MPPLLEVEGLHKSFGPINVLRGVDLTLRRRARCWRWSATTAPARSTLIKHIAGIYRPDAGEIRLQRPADLRAIRRARCGGMGIETVYQDLALADELSVGANIFLGREPVRRLLGFLPIIDNRRIRDETEALLRSDRKPHSAQACARCRGCPAASARRCRSRARSTGRPRS